MTENPSGGQPQQGTGKTAGLPGENADPRNSEVPDDQLDSTVLRGDVAPVPDDSNEPPEDVPRG